MDSFLGEEYIELFLERGWPPFDVGNSAGEYVFANAEGGHVVVTDEGDGMGFITIAPYTEELCADPFGGAGASALSVTMSLALTLFAFY